MKKVLSTLVAVSISLAMALTLPSCSNGGGGGDDDPSSSSGNSLLLNFTSDYTNGILRWMKTDTTDFNLKDTLLGFDQDSKVFAHNGRVFLLERPLGSSGMNGGKLNCLDVRVVAGKPSVVRVNPPQTLTLAAGSNPYDIAFHGGIGYIAQYGLNYLQAFNENTCSQAGQIPLREDIIDSPIFGPGSSANAASIKVSGDTLLVVMQRWIQYPPDTVQANRKAAKGILIRVKTDKTDVDTIQLKYYNPQSSVLKDGKLYVASAYDLFSGIYPDSSGVEFVTLSNRNKDTLVSGNRLRGGVTSMALDSAGQLYTGVYKEWGDVPVYRIPIGNPSSTPYQVPDIDEATCMVYDKETQKLFIGNGTPYSGTVTDPALWFYTGTDPATEVGNSDYPANAFPPYSLAIVRY